jgi:hypothetical protein
MFRYEIVSVFVIDKRPIAVGPHPEHNVLIGMLSIRRVCSCQSLVSREVYINMDIGL